MRKANIYIFIVIAVVVLVYISQKFITGNQVSYGLAENQIRVINLDYPIEIKSIHVAVGQNIKEGDLLAEVYRTDLPLKIANNQFETQSLQSKISVDLQRIRGELEKAEAGKKLLTTNFESQVKQLELENNLQTQLLKSIGTFDLKNVENEVVKQKIAALQTQYKDELAVLNVTIQKLNEEAKVIGKPTEARIAALQNELVSLKKQESAQKIYAPQSGIVGDMILRGGEKLNAYTEIMKLYDTRPSIVTTYIMEGYPTPWEMNKEVLITSMYDPTYSVKGKVYGMGTRITLMPERLRKIPEINIWGRQLEIKIPADNKFLQGEKVKITEIP